MSQDQIKAGGRNVFAEMGYPDAETHQLKARIVSEIEDIIEARKLTQKAAGALMGISQPEVSRMLNGQFREYSVERLLRFLTLFNRDVEIVVRHRDAGTGTGKVTFTRTEGWLAEAACKTET
ncbi:helix-turn-helix transcriptional regulator [Breoghania sp. L-A4]|uniref:helix-turn-helix domain-containing protein n=1 Tax=Breoghania sp. L-A4 TaxID=2304600 RepID=UPI000E360709|nr:helix-turn-helix transcriptional regulator [Breoghania sp. L-A4]AXS39105.1 XRE family transcriptional regulator [Breoghania sp. L-A4]